VRQIKFDAFTLCFYDGAKKSGKQARKSNFGRGNEINPPAAIRTLPKYTFGTRVTAEFINQISGADIGISMSRFEPTRSSFQLFVLRISLLICGDSIIQI
jgi:hypothetical protein